VGTKSSCGAFIHLLPNAAELQLAGKERAVMRGALVACCVAIMGCGGQVGLEPRDTGPASDVEAGADVAEDIPEVAPPLDCSLERLDHASLSGHSWTPCTDAVDCEEIESGDLKSDGRDLRLVYLAESDGWRRITIESLDGRVLFAARQDLNCYRGFVSVGPLGAAVLQTNAPFTVYTASLTETAPMGAWTPPRQPGAVLVGTRSFFPLWFEGAHLSGLAVDATTGSSTPLGSFTSVYGPLGKDDELLVRSDGDLAIVGAAGTVEPLAAPATSLVAIDRPHDEVFTLTWQPTTAMFDCHRVSRAGLAFVGRLSAGAEDAEPTLLANAGHVALSSGAQLLRVSDGARLAAEFPYHVVDRLGERDVLEVIRNVDDSYVYTSKSSRLRRRKLATLTVIP
jgi:hypothetical protein